MQTTLLLLLLLLLLTADIQLSRPAAVLLLPAFNITASDFHNGNHDDNNNKNQSTLLPQPPRPISDTTRLPPSLSLTPKTPPESATLYDGVLRAAAREEKFQTLAFSGGRSHRSASEVFSSSLAHILTLSSHPSPEDRFSSLTSAAFSQEKRKNYSEDDPLMQNRLWEKNGRFETGLPNSTTSLLEGDELSAKRKLTPTATTLTKMETYPSNTIAITLEMSRSSANGTLTSSTPAEEVSESGDRTLWTTTTPWSGDEEGSGKKKKKGEEEEGSLTLVLVSVGLALLCLAAIFAAMYRCGRRDARQTQEPQPPAEAMQLMDLTTSSSEHSQTQNPLSPSYGVPLPAHKGQDDVMTKKAGADDVMTYRPSVANYEYNPSGLGARGQGGGPDRSDRLLWPPPALQGVRGEGV